MECPQYSTRLEAPGYLYVSSNTVSPALGPTSVPVWHLDPSSQFATIDTNRELGAAVPHMGGERSSVPMQHNVPGPRPTSIPNGYLDPSSRLDTIDMGQKVGAAVPLLRGPHLP